MAAVIMRAITGDGPHSARSGALEARQHRAEESIQEGGERKLRHRYRQGQVCTLFLFIFFLFGGEGRAGGALFFPEKKEHVHKYIFYV